MQPLAGPEAWDREALGHMLAGMPFDIFGMRAIFDVMPDRQKGVAIHSHRLLLPIHSPCILSA